MLLYPRIAQRGEAATKKKKKKKLWITNVTNGTNHTNTASSMSFPRKRESIYE
jgi:hypothetical protein